MCCAVLAKDAPSEKCRKTIAKWQGKLTEVAGVSGTAGKGLVKKLLKTLKDSCDSSKCVRVCVCLNYTHTHTHVSSGWANKALRFKHLLHGTKDNDVTVMYTCIHTEHTYTYTYTDTHIHV